MSGLAIAHLLVTKPPRRDWRSRHLRLTWSVGPPADRHGHSVCARSVALHFREATVTRAIPASRRIPCSSPTGCRTTGYTAAHRRCVRQTVPWRDTSRHILATRRKAPNLRREREKKDGCVQLHVRWPPDHARVAWLHLESFKSSYALICDPCGSVEGESTVNSSGQLASKLSGC